MENNSKYQKKIEYPFDSFWKDVLRNYVRDIYNEIKQ